MSSAIMRSPVEHTISSGSTQIAVADKVLCTAIVSTPGIYFVVLCRLGSDLGK